MRYDSPEYPKLKVTGEENGFSVVARGRTYVYPYDKMLDMITFIQEWADEVITHKKEEEKDEG